MENNTEHLGLIPIDLLEKSPAIKSLIKEFENKLPKHFGKARFIPAPSISNINLKHVIRADCSYCKTRAVVHVVRENHILNIKEKDNSGEIKISYDRTNNCCSKCKNLEI